MSLPITEERIARQPPEAQAMIRLPLAQVQELPKIKPLVTEYQFLRLNCRSCGATTCAPLPVGVPQGQAGPRLIALAALLMGCLLLRGVFSGKAKLIGMCEPLYDHRDWLWTFLGRCGGRTDEQRQRTRLAPGGHLAKTVGRHANRGSRFVETILTVVETCHRQSRNSFDYLTAAMHAHFTRQPARSLPDGA